jgi:hypothetical protein
MPIVPHRRPTPVIRDSPAAAYWRDDSNFQPLLPKALADRVRPAAYAGGIVLVLLFLPRMMYVEVGAWWNWVLSGALIAALGWLASRLDPAQAWAEEAPDCDAPIEFPAYTGVTTRLPDLPSWCVQPPDLDER